MMRVSRVSSKGGHSSVVSEAGAGITAGSDRGCGGTVSTRRGVHAGTASTAATTMKAADRIGANANIRGMIRQTSLCISLLGTLLTASPATGQTPAAPH